MTDQLIAVFGAGRVGVKISPFSEYNDMKDSDPIAVAQHVARELSKKKIAFMEVAENFSFDHTNEAKRTEFFSDKPHKNPRAFIKPHLTIKYIANAGFDYEKGTEAVQNNEADLISFGTNFICNPDLVERCKEGTPLRHLGNVKDMGKLFTVYFYMGGAEGYTDLSPYEA